MDAEQIHRHRYQSLKTYLEPPKAIKWSFNDKTNFIELF